MYLCCCNMKSKVISEDNVLKGGVRVVCLLTSDVPED